MIGSLSASKLTAGTINGSVINVTNLNADNITAGTLNGQRIGEGSLSLDKLSEDVYTEAEVDAKLSTMQSQIDGAIETWTGTAVPTLQNSPASSWNTTALKDSHVGDVYFVVNSNSQQNGYNYRFTKSGSTYSWQLIKDSDVTNALQRLNTAEGKITTFDSDISQLKTDTGTLTTKTTSLETRMSDAEADILDKVDTTTFNEVSDTVDSHSQSISQMSTTLSNKADSSTVSAVTQRVSKNEQDISGINTTIGQLQTTVESKADGSTVETMSTKLNTVSDTVDGHTQSISSIISTQTTMQGKLDKTLVETTQLWFSKANTTAPNKPTAQVTSTSTEGNAWRVVVPAYNASYPNYYYCYQWKYSDGTYGWSSVTRDIAMGESQERARTAITNAAAADTKAGNAASAAATAQSTADTANSNASAAVSTANTANSNASTALSTANTAASDASDAKADAATAVSTANTASTNASTALSTANTASTNASTAVSTANTAKSTADTAKATADKNVKSTTQLWYTKANDTAPAKPTSRVTSTAVSGNGWRVVVPTYASDYPYYFYCYQYELADGTFTWSDVVYDRATTENQSNSRNAVTGVSTLTTKTNDIQDTVDGHTQSLQSITQTQTSIQQNAVKSTVQLWFTKSNTTAPNKPTAHVTTNSSAVANAWNLAVPTYNASYPNYYYCYEYQYVDGSYGWSAVTRDIATGEMQERARTAITNAAAADTKAGNAATAAANAQADIDNLNVGGRNLVRWSASPEYKGGNVGKSSDSTGWYAWSTSTTGVVDTDEGIKCVFTGNSTGLVIPLVYDNAVLGDEVLTISFDYRGTLETVTSLYLLTRSGGNVTQSGSYPPGLIVSETNWQHYEYTFKFASLGNRGATHSILLPYTTSNGKWFEIKDRSFKLEKGNRATDWTPAPEDVDADILTAQTSADNAQATADKNVKESTQLWFTKANGSAPAKPTSKVTSTSTSGNAWTTKVPTYNASYPHYFYCMQYIAADGTVTWSDVVYDQATTEAQSVARTTSANLSTLQQDYATFKQTTQNFESTIGTTYATKTEVSAVDTKIDNLEIGGRNLLLDTADFGTAWFSVKSKETIVFEENGIFYAKLWHSDSSSWTQYVRQTVTFELDTPYTLSLLVRKTNTDGVDPRLAIRNDRGAAITFFTPNTGCVISNTEWKRYVFTINKVHASSASEPLVIYALLTENNGALGPESAIQIAQVKLEKGNKPTDWSPAPEDIDAAIAASPKYKYVTSAYKTSMPQTYAKWLQWGQEGTVLSNFVLASTAEKDKLNVGDLACCEGKNLTDNKPIYIVIEVTSFSGTASINGISHGLIDPEIRSTVNTIESRVTNAETSITQNTEQIALRAKSSDVYTKTQTDGLISTEVSNRNSAIEQSASAINLSVSQNYTTKTEFNNLEIGGRNLLLKSQINPSNWVHTIANTTTYTGDGYENTWTMVKTGAWEQCYLPVTVSQDTEYTFSLEYIVGKAYNRWSASTPLRFQILPDVPPNADNRSQEIAAIEVPSVVTPATRDSVTFTASSDTIYLNIAGGYVADGTTNLPIEFNYLKLEKGNKATDWTPAPEDMVSQTEFESAKSEIKATTDGITSTVSKISSAKYLETSYQYALSSIRIYAAENYTGTWAVTDTKDAKVGDTVYLKVKDSTRNCYIYIKATVKAISGKNVSCTSHGYEDVLPVDTIKSTINQSSDSVKIQARHVEIDGAAIFSNTAFKAAADAAYDAKGSASAVQTNLDNLEIGGANLIGRFNYIIADSATYDYLTGTITSTTIQNTANSSINLQVYNNTSVVRQIGDGYGESYVGKLCNWTFEKKSDFNRIRVKFNGNKRDSAVYWDVSSIPNGTKLSFSCILKSISSDGQGNGGVMSGINLRTGNMPSQWSLAPEDVEVGGRNLFVDTDRYCDVAGASSASSAFGGESLPDRVIPEGRVITISVEVNADNVVWSTASGQHRIGVEFSITKTGGGAQYIGAWAGSAISEGANVVEAFTGSLHKRIYKTFTLLGDITVGRDALLYIQGVSSGSIRIGRVKVEYGNKATDWTPAPEDVNSAISDVEDSIPTKVSQLTNDSNFATANNVATAKQEAIAASYANMGFKYKKDIVIYGESSKYYPVYLNNDQTEYSQNSPHEIVIARGYSEQAPSDWNTATHKGSLNLRLRWNYGGWGGATYVCQIYDFSEMYSTVLGDVLVGNVSGMCSTVYLRGGGTTGAIYHIYSEVALDTVRYGGTFPHIGTDTGEIFMESGQYNWKVANPLTTPNRAHILSLAAVVEEQYIYRSAASGTNSMAVNETWVTANGEAQNVWTTKRPTYNSSYPVLFVAKQRKTAFGLVTCTNPVKDDTTTIIDGGHITTGTIDTNRLNADTIKSNIVQTTDLNADKITSGTINTNRLDAATIKSNIVQTTDLNADKITSGTIAAARIAAGSIAVGKIDATSGTFNTANIPDLNASKITAGDIAAARIKANVISAINSLTAGTINADRIDAANLHVNAANIDGSLTIGDIENLQSTLNGKASTSAIPTKVSDLTNDSGFQTSSQVDTAITSKGYATTEQAQGYADAKDSAIAAAAKRTDVSIAVTAINYDLGTATLQATLYIDGTATTSGVTYKWLKDGTVISGQTGRTLSVTAAMGLSHVYSCTVTYS